MLPKLSTVSCSGDAYCWKSRITQSLEVNSGASARIGIWEYGVMPVVPVMTLLRSIPDGLHSLRFPTLPIGQCMEGRPVTVVLRSLKLAELTKKEDRA